MRLRGEQNPIDLGESSDLLISLESNSETWSRSYDTNVKMLENQAEYSLIDTTNVLASVHLHLLAELLVCC